LVPIFSGNLNFIASRNEDYWYLNIKLPPWKKSAYYPVLIYSWDIAVVARAIEEVYEDIADVDELFFILSKKLDTNNRSMEKELEIPYTKFPYYEGMNRMGLDQYWLGLYWRNNRYDLDFLKELCGFCLDNSIGKICITPWKSFIIKGIRSSCRPELERFLGQRGINVRHSQLEMNWHVPVEDKEALELKKFLVMSFDQNDISTYWLNFGISSETGKRTHFSSIVIEKNTQPTIVKSFEVRPTYNILHFKNFDPNTQNYKTYAQDVDKIELPGLLMELSKNYFDQLKTVETVKKPARKAKISTVREIHQCQSCLTVYDEVYGDTKSDVLAGTPFQDLSEDYICPVCESPKSGFRRTELQLGN
jgi:rubredoxin